MEIATTAALLTLLLAALVVLSRQWPRLAAPSRRRLRAIAAVLAVVLLLNAATKWETTSEPVNSLFHWLRVLGYSTVVIFFTRLRPRWLTALIAVILLAPVFASTFIAPLSAVLRPVQTTAHRATPHLVLDTTPWSSTSNVLPRNSGVDFVIAVQPTWLPGLRRSLENGRLYNSQCDTAHPFLTVDQPNRRIDLHCPAVPARHLTGTELHFDLPSR